MGPIGGGELRFSSCDNRVVSNRASPAKMKEVYCAPALLYDEVEVVGFRKEGAEMVVEGR